MIIKISLVSFSCHYNPITQIKNLPYSLRELYLIFGKITHVDNLEISHFKNKNFILKKYQVFRRFQLRLKLLHMKKVRAIKTIQNACHNWIFAPCCRDDNLGIRPRLDLLALGIKDKYIFFFIFFNF